MVENAGNPEEIGIGKIFIFSVLTSFDT